MQAVWRLVGLVYLFTIGWILLSIASAAAFIYMVIDVILQLVTGGSGLSGGWLARIYDWGIGQVQWVFLGRGSFPWTP